MSQLCTRIYVVTLMTHQTHRIVTIHMFGNCQVINIMLKQKESTKIVLPWHNMGTTYLIRGLPLITYAPRGGGGVNTYAYKCIQGGKGGSEHDQKYAFCTQVY